MPEHDPTLALDIQRLERAGFYRQIQDDPMIPAVTQVLARPLTEGNVKPVDNDMFRDDFFNISKEITRLIENLGRDITRLEKAKEHIPHVAPADIRKRKGWIEQLDSMHKILSKMLHGD